MCVSKVLIRTDIKLSEALASENVLLRSDMCLARQAYFRSVCVHIEDSSVSDATGEKPDNDANHFILKVVFIQTSFFTIIEKLDGLLSANWHSLKKHSNALST